MKYIRLLDWPRPSEKASDYVSVEGFENMNHEQRLVVVSNVVKAHFIRNEGRCAFYGAITGYRFFHRFDDSVLFDVNGKVVGFENGTHRWPDISVRIANKTIRGGLSFLITPSKQNRNTH